MLSRLNLPPYSVLLTFTVISAAIAVGTFSGAIPWAGTAQLHTGLESIATVLAFVVGVSLLTRYAISGGSKTLLLGLGFAGTGVLDGYHSIVTSVAFADAFPTVLDSLSPWSWVPSRLLLGAMFFLVALDLPFSKLEDQKSGRAFAIAGIVAALTLFTLLFFAFVPLPKAQFDVWGIGRPQELIPAVLFAVALVRLSRSGDWKKNSFDMWVLVAVIANLFAQMLFMPFSDQIFDSEFDVAHVYKILSYVAMFTAVMTDMKRTIVKEQEAAGQLDAFGILLSVSAEEITPEGMFPVVAEQVAKLVPYDRLTISTTDLVNNPDSVVLVYQTGVSLQNRPVGTVLSRAADGLYDTPLSLSIMVDDVTVGDSPDLAAAAAGLKAWAEVPLVAGGEHVGMLSVRSKQAGAYTQRDLDMLQSAAGYLAPTLKNAFMVDRIIKSEQKLKEQSLELQNSNQSLEQFAYVASHDLQEPLRKVSAFGDRLKTSLGDDLPEKSADYLRRMISAAMRMQELVQGLLEFSRVGSANSDFVPVDLSKVVEEAQDSLTVAIRESDAEFEISQLGTVSGNATQLKQVFANLIINSIRYRRPDVTPEITISASLSDSELTITYVDNGQGFESQYEQQIFEIFKRLHTRDEVAGTGLGLALCRRIIEKHHGTITAHGNPGKGAVFLIKLPAATPMQLPDELADESPDESSDAA